MYRNWKGHPMTPHKLAAAVIVLTLTACDDPIKKRQMVLIDTESGCQYIGRLGSDLGPAFLDPRIGGNGKQICAKVAP